MNKKEFAKHIKKNFNEVNSVVYGSKIIDFEDYESYRVYCRNNLLGIDRFEEIEPNKYVISLKKQRGLIFFIKTNVLSSIIILLFMCLAIDGVKYAITGESLIIGNVVQKIEEIAKNKQNDKLKLDDNVVVSNGELPNGKPIDASLLNTEGKIDYSKVNITVAGYDDTLIDSKNPNITLMNLDTNYAYLQFELISNDKTVYASGLVAPGKQLDVNLFKVLGKGDYKLTIRTNFVSMNDGESFLNNTEQEIRVLVE